MVGESNPNGILIQIDALSFADFKISEFEISRFDYISSPSCINILIQSLVNQSLNQTDILNLNDQHQAWNKIGKKLSICLI